MIPNLTFPFYIRVFGDTEPQETVLELRHAIDMEDDLEGEPDRIGAWTEVFEHLANIVSKEGLCGPRLPAGGASLDVDAIIEEASDNIIEIQFRVRGVAPGFWRILSGLIASAHECDLPLHSARLVSTEDRVRKVLDNVSVWEQPYPDAPQDTPFSVVRLESPDATRNRAFRISFQSPVSEELITQIDDVIYSWEELQLGGFPDDDQTPVENASDGLEVYLEDLNTVEHAIDDFSGSESAFNVIVALAAWFHRQGMYVQRVEIE